MLKDSLAINSLLGQKASSRKHGKTSVLKLLGNHNIELLGILGLQAKGIKSNVTRVVVGVQCTGLVELYFGGVNPTSLGTLQLSEAVSSNDEGIPASGNLAWVGDGRARDGRIEEEGRSLNGLTDEESDNGKHGNTAVGHLGLTVTLEGGLIGLLSKSKRIEEAHGSKSTGKVSGVEGIEAGGASASLGRGEGSGGAGKGGDKSKLHHFDSVVYNDWSRFDFMCSKRSPSECFSKHSEQLFW